VGKPETGKVELNAYHEGGHIIIEINDDGRGLAVDKIRQKAIENGLTTEAEADGMSDHQIQQFVMRAGFSTAAKVTSVSGRGVGMDVVRSNIEKIGGTIDFKSVEGKGTHFTIKIPLTLAIVAALIVESGAERFAIPQLSVVELVRASADSEHRIETINDTPVLRLRDRLLPLIRLDQVLGLEAKAIEEVATDATEQVEQATADDASGSETETETETETEATTGEVLDETSDDVSFVVVTQAGSVSFGLLVDRVFDSEEIVVKPVSPILREIGVFSGNTILGDGSVIMILDPNGLSASVGAEAAAETSMEQSADVSTAAGEEAVSILVFRAGSEEPKSVPLALVARLEEIAVEDIEQTESGYVVQYRGQLMPLVMGDPMCQFKEAGRQSVLVFADERHTMGLVVDEIIDIVDQTLDVELVSQRQGIVGTAVIDGKATEVLDVAHFLTDAFDDWFVGADNSGGPSSGEACKVLVVDDSPFFRSMLMPVLTVAGYKPMAVESPAAALQLRDKGHKFNLIISDIEMPGMDGFEFAQEVKSSGSWQNTPMVALSSRSMQQDFDRGREVGFDDYVTKFDRDTLLATITQTLSIAAGDSA
jgi:two-component system, chemotaxis family, sensor kinase CheA